VPTKIARPAVRSTVRVSSSGAATRVSRRCATPKSRVGDRLDDVQDAVEIERPEAGQRGDGRALDVLHRDVADAAAEMLDFAGLVDDGDVGMIESGGGARLGEQTLGRVGLDRIDPEGLERDVPAQSQILGAVHVAHAAGTESFEDAVVRKRLADHPFIITQESQGIFRPLTRRDRVTCAA
jgi:hypothetical protein